ncbi:MAG: hypothetical protein KAT17_05375 [Candidatus Aminicenantes bacterium]|nr:hypothetical protein [Candidatus Aminicenantes bacterium]
MSVSSKSWFPGPWLRKEIIEKFRQSGACSVDLAKSVQDLKLKDSSVFRNLIRKGIVVHAGGKTYFLDEQQWLRHRLNRVKWGMIVLFVILFALCWGLF